ncbi:MAG TPA: BON domain-containing protein [Burkholderiales bacterium]
MTRKLAIALVALFASAAWAQKSPSGNAGFDGLDKNRDGFLSKEEIAGDKEMEKRFARFDGNKDGRWTLDDYIKAHKDNDTRITNDTAITTKVKSALLLEKGIPSTSISVETYEGRVQLSGFVDKADIKDKAGKVAAGVSGVKAVENKLAVK